MSIHELETIEGRDQIKNEILSLLIAKYDSSQLVDGLRAEVDKKAREIRLKSCERTELILEAKKIRED